MMLYEQAANEKYCPVKSGANILLILGHFQKCLTVFFAFLSNMSYSIYIIQLFGGNEKWQELLKSS
jgi:hypothetical protein